MELSRYLERHQKHIFVSFHLLGLLFDLTWLVGAETVGRWQVKEWGRKLVRWYRILPLVILLRSRFYELILQLGTERCHLARLELWLGHSIVTLDWDGASQIILLLLLVLWLFLGFGWLFNSDKGRCFFALDCIETDLVYLLLKFVEVRQKVIHLRFLFI